MMEYYFENKYFWRDLILDKKVDSGLWNRFLVYKYPGIEKSIVTDGETKKLWSEISQMSQGQIEELKEIEKRHGKPIKLFINQIIRPSMDFSKFMFNSEVSFARRVLIGADFQKTIFNGVADFRETFFLEEANFMEVNFLGEVPIGREVDAVVSFQKSSFNNGANFNDVQFPNLISFDEAKFNSYAHFQKAIFGQGKGDGFINFNKAKFKKGANFKNAVFTPLANFKKSQFNSNAHFSGVQFNSFAFFQDTEFNQSVNFDDTEFNHKTYFSNTKFDSFSIFNNAKFQNTISFNGASFSRSPKFFNTDLHEDMDFFGINWSGAEQFYSRKHRQKDDTATIIEDANVAIRSWDRLALIMSKQEKPAERHVFFRLKMRAQRQRDGITFLTILNLFFEELSDYGWGVGGAFLLWGLHIFLGAIILGSVVYFQSNGGISIALLKMFGYSLLVSFSNSVSFLGLGSEGGYLYGPSIAVNDAIEKMKWVFPTVGTVQAVLGPILLFLVLLALRNRFRLK